MTFLSNVVPNCVYSKIFGWQTPFDLQLQLKQAHWNVKGLKFIGLHELFDKIRKDVEIYMDEIVERAEQRDGIILT